MNGLTMKHLIVAAVGLCFSTSIFAQQKNDPVLVTVAGENVSKTEFEKVYRKNNRDNTVDRKSVEEYMELFINYKLKVKEAMEQKKDTARAFRDELEGYRKQLAQPYLTDKSVTEKLMKEAYDRMQKDIRASHILIRVSDEALPKDTAAAYAKILKVRDRIIKGEDFGKVAKEVSEDPSAKENEGDLGYFTALQMVYPFENAAYSTKVGDVTMPIRTRFGYHILKVVDSRKDVGTIKAAHIMLKSNENTSAEDAEKAKQKIDEIYQKLKAGEKFEDLATQFSEDPGSATQGGALPWFGTGRMVVEFEKAAFKLAKPGDISEPIRTAFGWHIIKLLDQKPLPTYEEALPELKSKIAKDSRSELSHNSMVNKIKKEYNFKEFPAAKKDFFATADSSLVQAMWSQEKAAKLTKPLFQLGTTQYMPSQFAQFVFEHQMRKRDVPPQNIMNTMYAQWVEESAIAYEENRLSEKYPEFKALMQEYHDGIMLFELTDEKVWTKAVKDTTGLKDFYEKNKSNYMWKERADAVVYTCSNAEIAKQVRKALAKGKISNDSLLRLINKSSQLNLTVKSGKFQRGENEILDKTEWKKGLSNDIQGNNSVSFVQINEVLPSQPKALDEARGIVTADYQQFLEKRWIEELRKKYSYTVNKQVLSSVGL